MLPGGIVCRFLIALVLCTDPAADRAAALKRAEALYTDAQYPDAVAALDELLARPDLTPGERHEAMLYLGMGHLALGNEEAARARFREVLEADLAYALPRYTSPKIRTLFEQVRAQVRATPLLQPLPPLTEPVAAGPSHVRLRFRAQRLGERPARLYWRRSGQTAWVKAALSAAGEHELSADPSLGAVAGPVPDSDFDIEYYAEVRDGARVLAHVGTAADPLSVHVPVRATSPAPAATGTPFYKKWWFWGAVGLVAAGGATAAYLGTRGGPEPGALDIRFEVP